MYTCSLLPAAHVRCGRLRRVGWWGKQKSLLHDAPYSRKKESGVYIQLIHSSGGLWRREGERTSSIHWSSPQSRAVSICLKETIASFPSYQGRHGEDNSFYFPLYIHSFLGMMKLAMPRYSTDTFPELWKRERSLLLLQHLDRIALSPVLWIYTYMGIS